MLPSSLEIKKQYCFDEKNNQAEQKSIIVLASQKVKSILLSPYQPMIL